MSVFQHLLEGLIKPGLQGSPTTVSHSVSLGWGLRICTSNESPGTLLLLLV